MMDMNLLGTILAAVSSLVVGAIYYHPAVLGKVWMKASGMTEEKVQTGNMAVIFGLALLMAFILAFTLDMIIPGVHLTQGGHTHATFKHGMLHGGVLAIMLPLPIITIVSLFERRSARYVLVHFGYWFLTMMFMGGFVDWLN